MTTIADWKDHEFLNIKIDDLRLDTPTGLYINKLMTALKKKFDAVDAKLAKVEGAYVYRGTKATETALPSTGNSVGDVYNVSETGANWAWNGETWDELGGSGGGGGGGGTEEQFQKVYETTLEEETTGYLLTSEDMGGAYVDVVVYIIFEAPANIGKTYCYFYGDDRGDDYITGGEVSAAPGEEAEHSFVCMSMGGLLFLSEYSGDLPEFTHSGFPAWLGGGEYPAQGKPGVSSIEIGMTPLDEAYFPIGTQITVYARRKVTLNDTAEEG